MNIDDISTSDDTSNFRIMIVDDEEDITTTYKLILQNNGFEEVDVFNNPFEALEQFRKSPEGYYDILLIDMRMPGMNGVELYRELKTSNKKLSHICFISAHSEFYNLLKQSFPEINEKCFIRKPIDEYELVTAMKQELQKSS